MDNSCTTTDCLFSDITAIEYDAVFTGDQVRPYRANSTIWRDQLYTFNSKLGAKYNKMISPYWISNEIISFCKRNIANFETRKVVDMFAGVGGDTLRFAAGNEVIAIENDSDAVAMLEHNMEVYCRAGLIPSGNVAIYVGDNKNIINKISFPTTSVCYCDPPRVDRNKSIIEKYYAYLPEFIQQHGGKFEYVVFKLPKDIPFTLDHELYYSKKETTIINAKGTGVKAVILKLRE